MSIFYQRSAILASKSLLLSTLLIGGMPLLASCDRPHPSADNNNNGQTDKDKKIAANEPISSENQQAHSASAPSSSTADVASNDKMSGLNTLSDDKSVSPVGYQTLSFGQVVSPALLTKLGLTKENSDNEQCYYVSNPTLSYNDKADGERASVLYQVIDDKVALITIQDPTTLFYTGIQVGDGAGKVMTAHDNNLMYEVDKYAVAGDYYNLIANVNFKVIREDESDALLQSNDIKLDNQQDKLPLQVKYHMKGGQPLGSNQVKANEWTAQNKNKLKGQVERIDIGIPEAIYLVEGCS